MGSTSRYGRAKINPSAPEAVGVCDGCGKLWNLRELRFQFDWAGTSMINRQIRVCPDCYDRPQEQLRTIILPADPPPVWQPRPEPYLVDEPSQLTIRIPPGAPGLFYAAASITAHVEPVRQILASISAAFTLTSSLIAGLTMAPAVSVTATVTCELTIPVDHITTEGGDILTTEAGDQLITE
jgi:hypothetical protein